jgi:hypothetical protein
MQQLINRVQLALSARIAAKKAELENLRQLRDLSGTLAIQMQALDNKWRIDEPPGAPGSIDVGRDEYAIMGNLWREKKLRRTGKQRRMPSPC